MVKPLTTMTDDELWEEGKRRLDAFGEVLQEQEVREKISAIQQQTVRHD